MINVLPLQAQLGISDPNLLQQLEQLPRLIWYFHQIEGKGINCRSPVEEHHVHLKHTSNKHLQINTSIKR